MVSPDSGKKNKRNNKHNLNSSNINNYFQNSFVLLNDISPYTNSIASLN